MCIISTSRKICICYIFPYVSWALLHSQHNVQQSLNTTFTYTFYLKTTPCSSFIRENSTLQKKHHAHKQHTTSERELFGCQLTITMLFPLSPIFHLYSVTTCSSHGLITFEIVLQEPFLILPKQADLFFNN